MTKRPKHINSRAAKIARGDLAQQILDAWNERGLEAAYDLATAQGARISTEYGAYAVALSGLTVDHPASFRAALRRWTELALEGQHGHHPIPKRPAMSCGTQSVIQARIGVPTQQARAARGETELLDTGADQ